ncbi:MAG: glycosyl hydrolase [Algibacter sp.]|uniref:glycosyl hydrolase n=1 Tax=Algibacter sp. TaxID=1872428 RepID=UPI002625B03C|nr:glycosyl hydrolase [Algibacter sp.]MDG2179025.1 glycosyl hydrolase [Algibacter sp.]
MSKTKQTYSVILLIILCVTFSCTAPNISKTTISVEDLRQSFQNSPDSIQTAVYWYWISDNISKEGIVKDLQAMKKAGINRAFIGNIGLDNVPYGKVKMLSDEWWDCIHLALKTATELDIEIGVFNSPGWSQSGGPWIKAKNSMRYLASSETYVEGPMTFSKKKLEQPNDLFEDVEVIAFPMPKNYKSKLDPSKITTRSNQEVQNLNLLFDGKKDKPVYFSSSTDFILDVNYEEQYTARSISLDYPKSPIYAKVQLQFKGENGAYKTHHEFEMDRSRFALDVGFNVQAPLQISFAPIESKNFRLKFTFLKHKDWPSPGINKNPGLTEITISSQPLLGNYAEKSLAKMHPTPLPKFDDYNWDDQVEPEEMSMIVSPKEVINLSDKLEADGTLNWEVPPGKWIILRTGMTPTGIKNGPASPEATGYEVDKISKAHVEQHFYGHIGEILKRIPEEDRKTFKVVVQDSYEKGGQNMTDTFLEDFEKAYGYDPVPFLPTFNGIVVKSQLASDRFLWDVRRMVADKVAYEYVGGLKQVSNKHGLTTWLENYGHWGFPGEFLLYGSQSDEISGEFWSEGSLGDIENRAAISCGHIYGKSKIWAESFTCGKRPFSRTPAMLKARGDRFFAEGINSTLLHVYIHQPYEEKNPGVNAWFGNPFNRKNTWFEHMDIFTDYLKRTNLMLQQGLNVADIAYFIGENTPIMTGVTNPELPIGYEFDFINADVILNDMTINNGLFTLPNGTQYKVLILPELDTMSPELLSKIKALVEEGGIILGSPPLRSPSNRNQPEADNVLKQTASQLWGEVDGKNVTSRKLGKGLVLQGLNLEEVFTKIKLLPDCKLPEDNSIHYGHRKSDNTDIYFLSNQTNSKQIINPEFRVTNMIPELWQANTGEIRELNDYNSTERFTSVPLKLEPYESVFIVFSKDRQNLTSKASLVSNYPIPKTTIDISSNWEVEFDSLRRGPKGSIKLDSLVDWTSFNDKRIKYYSGKAVYTKTFNTDNISKTNQVVLDLGSLSAIARVYLNGKEVGGIWTAPYSINITNFIISGKNELKVEVINNWMNRLIGDASLPKSKRQTWCTYNPYKDESELQSSGLLGPITIEIIEW